MRLVDADKLRRELLERKESAREWFKNAQGDEETMVRADSAIATFIECILTLDNAPTVEP